MATLGKWSGGTTSLLPTTSWAAPNALFPTQDRNDGSAYSFASATSTLTLPASGLADGYLLVAAFEFEDTSNGRHNPQGKIIQASGTGNFVGGPTGGYNRDNSEDRAYVRCFAFVDNPSASATFQFQWKRDTDAPTGGTVRSEFQVIPLYYSNHGIYSSTTAALYGGTTPNQVTGWSAVNESDTAAIELVSNVVTVKGDNKNYLVFGSQFYEGRGGRTQRWFGLEIDNVQDNAAKACAYYRQSSVDELGGFYTQIVQTVTANRTIESTCYRGDGVAALQGGADIDGSTPTVGDHTLVVLELNDSAEVFLSESNALSSNVATTGPVDLSIAPTGTFTGDSASWTRASDTGVNAEVAMDALLGANIGCAQNTSLTTGSRWTAYAEITVNGAEDADSFHGNYMRNNQSSQDCFGWSANLLGFQALALNDDVGVSVTELAGSEGGNGTINSPSGWSGFWGINLDTLEAAGGPVTGTGAVSQTGPTVSGSGTVATNDVGGSGNIELGAAISVSGAGTADHTTGDGAISLGGAAAIAQESFSYAETTSNETSVTVAKPSGVVQGDELRAFHATFENGGGRSASGWTLIEQNEHGGGKGVGYAVYRKTAGASEPANYTFNGPNGRHACGIVRLSGALAGAEDAKSNSLNPSASASPVTPAITTVASNTLVYRFFAADKNKVDTEDANYPSGYTGVYVRNTNGDLAVGLAYKSESSAGSKGTATFSGVLVEARDYVSVSISFAAAASGNLSVSGEGTASATAGASGTGNISQTGPTVAGDGTASQDVGGTGAVSRTGPTVASAGIASEATGDGAISRVGPSVAGSGLSGSVSGSGAVARTGPSVTGSGASAEATGQGSVARTGPSVAGSGTSAEVSGDGAISQTGPTIAGAGTVVTADVSGTGAIDLVGPAIAGDGVAAADVGGIGAIDVTGPTIGGAGTSGDAATGTGSISLGGATVQGAGTAAADVGGIGAVALAGPTIDGAGTVETVDNVGNISLTGPSVNGAGTSAEACGVGVVSLAGPGVSGTGISAEATGDGSVSLQTPTVEGAGTSGAVEGAGAVDRVVPSVVAQGTVGEASGAGVVALQGSTVIGTGSVATVIPAPPPAANTLTAANRHTDLDARQRDGTLSGRERPALKARTRTNTLKAAKRR